MFQHIKHLLGHSLIYGLGTSLNQALSLLILPLFTAYLSPEDYGINSFLTLLSTFLVGFLCLGLGNAINLVYFEQKTDEGRALVIGNSLFLLLPGVGVLVGVMGIGTEWISQQLFASNQYQFLVLLSVLSSIYTILGLPLNQVLQLEEKSKINVGISVAVTLTNLGLSTVLIAGYQLGILGRFLGHNVGIMLMLLLALYFSWKSIAWRLDGVILKRLIRYGLPTIPGFLFYFMMQQGNIYFLKTFGSLKEVGLYSIGFTFGSALAIVVNAFLTAWPPFFWQFQDKLEEARTLFGKIMSYYLLLVGGLSLCLYLGAKPLILLFTSQSSYYAAYKIIGLSSTQSLLVGVGVIVSVETFLAKDIQITVYLQMFTTLIFLGLSWWLTASYLAEGAAWALILSQAVGIGLNIAWNKMQAERYLRVQYELGRIVKFIGYYVLIAAICYWEGAEFNGLYLMLHSLLGVLVTWVFWSQLLTPSERDLTVSKAKAFLSKSVGTELPP